MATIDLILYGYFGMAINFAFQAYKHYPRIKKQGGWSWGYYFSDNLPRLVLCLLIIPAAIKFPSFFPGIEIKPTQEACFGLGLLVDTAIDSYKNRKK